MTDKKTELGQICDYGAFAGHEHEHGGEAHNSAGAHTSTAQSPYPKEHGLLEEPEPSYQDSNVKNEYNRGAQKP